MRRSFVIDDIVISAIIIRTSTVGINERSALTAELKSQHFSECLLFDCQRIPRKTSQAFSALSSSFPSFPILVPTQATPSHLPQVSCFSLLQQSWDDSERLPCFERRRFSHPDNQSRILLSCLFWNLTCFPKLKIKCLWKYIVCTSYAINTSMACRLPKIYSILNKHLNYSTATIKAADS